MAGFSLDGAPALLQPIQNFADAAKIATIPGVSGLLNVPSIPALQAVPDVTRLLNVSSTSLIPAIPNVNDLLNVPDLSALISLPNVNDLLDISRIPNLFQADEPGVNIQAAGAAVWGIFLNGDLVIHADSFVSIGAKRDWRVPDYPQENGAFQSYNKVNTPYDLRVKLTKGGSELDRQAFLAEVDAAAGSLDVYDVVTPEWTFFQANITHYDYDRRATNGLGLISVDIHLIEIREATAPRFTNTADPSGASPVNDGMVQPQPTTPAQQAPVQALNHGAGGSW